MMGIATNREDGGRIVRNAWIAWAQQQPDPKPSWLAPWEELSETDKEADRVIWDAIAEPYRAILAMIGTFAERQPASQQGSEGQNG